MTHGNRRAPEGERKPVISHGVLGVSMFVMSEVMFFAGLISAHTIARTSALTDWPPPGQPRLPVQETLLNTAALLLSGVLLALAHRQLVRGSRGKVPLLVAASIALGAFFVAFQGHEWIDLIHQGLTLTTSTHSAFFYLIVGAHGLHAAAALIAMLYLYRRLRRGYVSPGLFGGTAVFWYFVVLMWPILYVRVYL
jgi:heme/copper-type cytochrome/quinol oxidase subunit 3